MTAIPLSASLLFAGVTFTSVYFLYRATNKNRPALIAILFWLALQAALSYNGFYLTNNTSQPRLLLLPVLPILAALFFVYNRKGFGLSAGINPGWLNLIHVVRVPVEFFLYWLMLRGLVPETMTFEGRNFDIISGISGALVAFFGYHRKLLPARLLLLWNFLCLGLLVNIAVTGFLSAPSPIQQFSFDQPNIGVLLFPFVWLPSFIVPVVLFAHLLSIKKLLLASREKSKTPVTATTGA